MARGKWLERNEAAEAAIKAETAEYRTKAVADRAVVKQSTADYKAKWAVQNEARAADRLAVMTGEK